jgi:uncharacterized protein (DUF1330 family)
MTDSTDVPDFEALAALPPDQPVLMVNLLKFRSDGGLDSYRRYGEAVVPHLARVGGKVRYGGATPTVILGEDARPWWDAILVVEYPSPAAFVEMVTDPDYLQIHRHRAAALDRGDLIATTVWPPASAG